VPPTERYDLEGFRSQKGAKVGRTPVALIPEVSNGLGTVNVPGNEDGSFKPNGLAERFRVAAKG
jgi:hypothetical protein